MDKSTFHGRLALQQRILPAYRAPFFETLATQYEAGLSVFAGMPRPKEAVNTASKLARAVYHQAQNHHFLDVDHPLYLCWQRGLLDWLRTWDPTGLIVEANPRIPSTRIAVRWMHNRDRVVVGWGLGAPPLEGPLAGARALGRASFVRQFDALIAYSQRGRDEYIALGVPPERVFVASNAVAPRPTAPPPERPISQSVPPTVLFVGRLQARKRLDHLLQACAALPSESQPNLIIIGDGPAHRALQDLAARIYPQTIFPGPRFGTELTPYFASADIFVLPGTGGLAVQEAMAYGLPVIVAEGDGTQEDLVRAGNGWLVPPDDLQALTDTLIEALSDLRRLREMGGQSFRVVTEEINIEAMVAVFVKALNDAIGSPRP